MKKILVVMVTIILTLVIGSIAITKMSDAIMDKEMDSIVSNYESSLRAELENGEEGIDPNDVFVTHNRIGYGLYEIKTTTVDRYNGEVYDIVLYYDLVNGTISDRLVSFDDPLSEVKLSAMIGEAL